ncbi:hypothetical protein OG618_37200 (plasmid) [Kitasatospora sp. NBC_01246]|uniref:hypothetical protein n=1 Tax=Kitasatospora sp. NBC_01246 TaxID=2903570 RepID=UPI002E30133A|nr:hypothetical protein [Kitasatospora sp. NBC_01246]
MSQLESSVFVVDPDTHTTVVLAAGSTPEPRLACLVTNPSAWVGGRVPDLAPLSSPETGGATEADVAVAGPAVDAHQQLPDVVASEALPDEALPDGGPDEAPADVAPKATARRTRNTTAGE